MFDEIKVRSGVAYNPKNGKTMGFTSSKNGRNMSFAEEIMDLANSSVCSSADDDNSFSNKELEQSQHYVGAATYCNIWRARTDYNQTYNVGYFFSCGDMDGDDVVKQLLQVITACEVVGINVSWQMSDAGGANTRSLALLTNDQCNNLPDGKPSADCLRYVNPIRNKNWIWISLCSVHGLKASRNQISNNDLYHDGN